MDLHLQITRKHPVFQFETSTNCLILEICEVLIVLDVKDAPKATSRSATSLKLISIISITESAPRREAAS